MVSHNINGVKVGGGDVEVTIVEFASFHLPLHGLAQQHHQPTRWDHHRVRQISCTATGKYAINLSITPTKKS